MKITNARIFGLTGIQMVKPTFPALREHLTFGAGSRECGCTGETAHRSPYTRGPTNCSTVRCIRRTTRMRRTQLTISCPTSWLTCVQRILAPKVKYTPALMLSRCAIQRSHNQRRRRQPHVLLLTLIFFATTLLITTVHPLHAQTATTSEMIPLLLTDEQEAYPLGLHMEILEDAEKQWTIDDVASPEFADRFVPSGTDDPRIGFTDSAFWVRVQFQNNSSRTEWWLEHADTRMQYLDLFTPRLDGSGFVSQQTGAMRPFSTRDIHALTYVFALSIPPQSSQTIYVRYEHSRSRGLPLRLYTPSRFARANQLAMWRLAISFGIWLFLFCGTFLLWYRLRSQLFFTLIMITGGILFSQLINQGIGRQYLWPNLTIVPRSMDMIGGGFVYLGFLKFVTLFLETKDQYPRWHKVLTSLMILGLLVLLQIPFVADRYVAQQLAVLYLGMFALLLILGIQAWLRTYRTTRELTMVPVVIVAFVIFGILAILPNLGILARQPQTDQIDFMGFIIFAVLISTLIADRFAAGFQKQQEAQRKQEEIAAELRVANEELEKRVQERTAALRQARDAAREAQSEAETANRAKSTFLANMSHELRTPLTSILGYSELMNRDTALSLAQRRNLQIVQRSGEHLLLLIDDVLEMSRIEAGRTTLNAAPFDLYKLLAELADLFRIRAQNKGLQLDITYDADVPQFVEADGCKLRQVLMNLLSNAVKFTEVGGVVISVEIGDWGLEISDYQSPISNLQSLIPISFSVTDTGPGIAADELEIIFAPFGQTSTGQQVREGTGLGLAISRQFVTLMDGELTVSSTHNSTISRQQSSMNGERTSDTHKTGTTFYFTIPVSVAARPQDKTSAQPRRVVGLAAHQPQYHILVTDDDENNRQLLVNLLTSAGFAVRIMTNGQEAIDAWIEWHPHALLTDLRMPIMDGYAVARHIKAATTAVGEDHPLIIAVTASAFQEERAKILAAGCDDILCKPFRAQELFEMLQKHLDIDYVYADGDDAPNSSTRSVSILDSTQLSQALAALPKKLITQLSQAAIRSDMAGVEQSIDEIRTHHADLGDTLAALASEFAYEKITALVQAA
ncbi:response regulator [Chloroflexi bacterium TSY]|nr:response regulator [Chloroflexi bacterium TSY]